MLSPVLPPRPGRGSAGARVSGRPAPRGMPQLPLLRHQRLDQVHPRRPAHPRVGVQPLHPPRRTR